MTIHRIVLDQVVDYHLKNKNQIRTTITKNTYFYCLYQIGKSCNSFINYRLREQYSFRVPTNNWKLIINVFPSFSVLRCNKFLKRINSNKNKLKKSHEKGKKVERCQSRNVKTTKKRKTSDAN